MSRLYYEPRPPKIIRESDIKDGPGGKETTPPKGKSFTDYLDKVAHLVPSEIIAGYLTMMGFVGALKNPGSKEIFLWIIFGAGLILTPLYLNMVADKGKPKRNHLILSTLAFLVWALVTSGSQLWPMITHSEYDPAMASIILVLFSMGSAVVPLDK
jgi:hypothetical protein